MFLARNITQQQIRGVTFCVPKARGNQKPEAYRPGTLLNSDYKILAHITAQLLRPVLAVHHTGTQFCGFPRNTILHAVAMMRVINVYAESRMIRLCVLSLDFKKSI